MKFVIQGKLRWATRMLVLSAAAVGATLALVILSEGLLRVYYRRPIVERIYRPLDNIAGYGLQKSQHYEYAHHGRTVLVSTDAEGRRVVPGAPQAAPSTLYVIGDSQVFGWGLSDWETVPAALQHHLGSTWRVVNLGVPGYGPIAYAEELTQIPDDGMAVVIQAEVNDFQDAYFVHPPLFSRCGYLVTRSQLGESAPCFVLSSYLLARTLELIINFGGELPVPLGYQPYTQPAAHVLRYRIDDLYRAGAGRRAQPVLFTCIPWDAAIDSRRLKNYVPVLPAAVRLLELPDQAHIDLAFRRYRGGEELFQRNDSHLTSAGAELVAIELALQIRRIASGAEVITPWP